MSSRPCHGAFYARIIITYNKRYRFPRNDPRGSISPISIDSTRVPVSCLAPVAVCDDDGITSFLLCITWRMLSSRRLFTMHDIAIAKTIGISTRDSCVTG